MIDYRIGDCRELLKEIPDESVRLVVTSPPYNIGKPYGHYKDKIPLDKWQELISDVPPLYYITLRMFLRQRSISQRVLSNIVNAKKTNNISVIGL